MNETELDALLRRSSANLPTGALQSRDGDWVSGVLGRLGRRERWQDVCLLLGSASVIAFCLALAVACLSGPASVTQPALRLFKEQPASHPFAIP